MPAPGSALARLLDGPLRPGRVVWLGRRPARRTPMIAVDEALFDTGQGMVGDRYSGASGGRQVTLIQAEHLAAIAAHLGLGACVPPERLRRNVVTAGVNLLALKGRRLRLGPVLLETTGECHPCSRMEEELGPGGYNAVRGCGGLTARVLEGGLVRIGDTVARVDLAAGV